MVFYYRGEKYLGRDLQSRKTWYKRDSKHHAIKPTLTLSSRKDKLLVKKQAHFHLQLASQGRGELWSMFKILKIAPLSE